MRPLAAIVGLFCVLACVPALWPASGIAADFHLSSDPARALYRISAFAHGYRHGYDDGYSRADRDLQSGLTPAREKAEMHEAANGYQPGFGDAKSYRHGFLAGFRAGYADSWAGRTFRAVTSNEALAVGLPATAGHADNQFDGGFSDGYGLGLATDPHQRVGDLFYLYDFCITHNPNDHGAPAADYCQGYSRGFTLGAGDAQFRPPAEVKRAAK